MTLESPNPTEIVAKVLDENGGGFHALLTLSGLDAETYGLVIQFGEVCALGGMSAAIDAIIAARKAEGLDS